MKTYMAKAESVERKWYLIDAKDQVLGRLASHLAVWLRGKHKPEFTPHVDTGDFMVVINADQVRVTGNKAEDKQYHRHTGYPGGLKTENFTHLQNRIPARIIELAVKRMLPKGPLGRRMFTKLKVYAGEAHPHQAQKPQPIDLIKRGES